MDNLQKLLNQDPVTDVVSSDDEEEYIEYIYKPRQYFLMSLCNVSVLKKRTNIFLSFLLNFSFANRIYAMSTNGSIASSVIWHIIAARSILNATRIISSYVMHCSRLMLLVVRFKKKLISFYGFLTI